ncbi:hypothetical protein RHOER0001_5499 [Rhodococcus erythropolis SK121]|nr:hypothetical protein RHOER0001_5499 [Rhodococcus erythropolis SK121]
MMVFGPIDSAVQSHRASQCRCAGCEPVWCTRRPNCRTRRSVISPAVRVTSAPQGTRSAEELTARECRRRDRPCGGLVPRHFTTSNGALPGAVSLPEGVVCAGKKPGVGRAVHRQKHQTSVSVAARRSVLLHTN